MDGRSNPSRKRARSPDADCEECMPISKRIHNLNIRSRGCSVDDDGVECDISINNNVQLGNNCCCGTDRCRPQPGTSTSTDSTHWLSATDGSRLNGHVSQSPAVHPGPAYTNHGLPPAAQHTQNGADPYEPDLDATENPHYYHQNRLLYEAHIQRVRRTKPD